MGVHSGYMSASSSSRRRLSTGKHVSMSSHSSRSSGFATSSKTPRQEIGKAEGLTRWKMHLQMVRQTPAANETTWSSSGTSWGSLLGCRSVPKGKILSLGGRKLLRGVAHGVKSAFPFHFRLPSCELLACVLNLIQKISAVLGFGLLMFTRKSALAIQSSFWISSGHGCGRQHAGICRFRRASNNMISSH